MTDVSTNDPARAELLWVNHFAVAPSEGGGTRHYDVGSQLAERQWGVTIVASDFHYASRRYMRRSGRTSTDVITESSGAVTFQWFWSAPYEANDWRRVWNWLSFARSLLWWRPKTQNPAIVIGSTPHLFAALAAARLATRWNVPFVLEVRDLWPESMVAAGGRKGPAYFALDRIAQYLYWRADRIICLARGSVNYLEKHRGVQREKLLYIPNGVDPDASRGVTRVARSGLTLLYAGAHGPANGLEVVLDAAELLKEDTSIKFVLLGDGPAKADLARNARERNLTNVAFRDPLPKKRMAGVLAEVDAGLMVLRDTPLFEFGVSPNKLFDYMGASLPIVCNVGGEVAEMVRAAQAGELAEPGSAASLADAILRLKQRLPAERAAMGAAGREWVVREHSHRVLAQNLDAALRALLPT